jgi:hypothetical protein
MSWALQCRLIDLGYLTYDADPELVVYVSASKQTLLIPILAKTFLALLRQEFPNWCQIPQLPDDSVESVKKIVTLLERSGLVEVST